MPPAIKYLPTVKLNNRKYKDYHSKSNIGSKIASNVVSFVGVQSEVYLACWAKL